MKRSEKKEIAEMPEKKIARAKRKGGKAEKKAVFAQNMKRIAA